MGIILDLVISKCAYLFVFLSECDGYEGDADYAEDESCVVIYLHVAIHLQPCDGLLVVLDMLQHPCGFWAEYVVKIACNKRDGNR